MKIYTNISWFLKTVPARTEFRKVWNCIVLHWVRTLSKQQKSAVMNNLISSFFIINQMINLDFPLGLTHRNSVVFSWNKLKTLFCIFKIPLKFLTLIWGEIIFITNVLLLRSHPFPGRKKSDAISRRKANFSVGFSFWKTISS